MVDKRCHHGAYCFATTRTCDSFRGPCFQGHRSSVLSAWLLRRMGLQSMLLLCKTGFPNILVARSVCLSGTRPARRYIMAALQKLHLRVPYVQVMLRAMMPSAMMLRRSCIIVATLLPCSCSSVGCRCVNWIGRGSTTILYKITMHTFTSYTFTISFLIKT